MIDYKTIKKAQMGDAEAIEKILKEFKPIIKKWVYKYRFTSGYGIEQEDLEQIATCALYNSIMNYDLKSETSLTTYAYAVVKYAILSEIKKCQRAIGKKGYLFLEDITYEDANGNKIHYEEVIPGNLNVNISPIVVRDHNPDVLRKMMYKDPVNASIIDLLSKGYNRKQIAEILGIPVKEVYNRVYRMRRKAKVD